MNQFIQTEKETNDQDYCYVGRNNSNAPTLIDGVIGTD